MIVPKVLPKLRDARVAVVGGAPNVAAGAARKLAALLSPSSQLVAIVDGFGQLPRTEDAIRAWMTETRPTLVIVGLGAVLQERWALAAARCGRPALVVTCGGFLDQFARERYYPPWAYPLRLNWLVRLVREPRRLWRRYTLDALTACTRRRTLRRQLFATPGFQRLECGWTTSGAAEARRDETRPRSDAAPEFRA